MDNDDYIAGQFDRLSNSGTFKVKVTDGQGAATNWLDISSEAVGLLCCALMGQLPAALAELAASYEAWRVDVADEGRNGADFEHLADELAITAGSVLGLLPKATG